MKLKIALLSVALLASVDARAQQQPAPNPQVQAIGQKLIYEIAENVSCKAQSIVLERELAAAHAEIKRLTEPKKDTPPE